MRTVTITISAEPKELMTTTVIRALAEYIERIRASNELEPFTSQDGAEVSITHKYQGDLSKLHPTQYFQDHK